MTKSLIEKLIFCAVNFALMYPFISIFAAFYSNYLIIFEGTETKGKVRTTLLKPIHSAIQILINTQVNSEIKKDKEEHQKST